MTHKMLKLKLKSRLKSSCFLIFLLGMTLHLSAQKTLTIDQALDIAEENNPQMKNSKLSFERTQFALEAERASLKSQFSLNLAPFGYSQDRRFDNRFSEWYTNKNLSSNSTFRVVQPILFTDGVLSLVNRFGWQDNQSQIWEMIQDPNDPKNRIPMLTDRRNKAFSNRLSIQYDQPLFTYNRRKMALRQLEYDHENSGISYALQRLRTEQSITRQFYSVYSLQNTLAIRLEEFENAKKNFAIISDKVEAGLSAREELFQAEVNLASSESSVQQTTVSLNDAKDNLKQALGMSLSEDIVVVASIVISPMIVDPEKAIQSGLESRVELRQREISMELAEMQMIQVKARNEFKGDLSLSLGITGDHQNFGNIYENPTQSPSISIGFSIPIFDWGEKKARIKAQERAQTIARNDYENTKIDIELNIRSTLRSLDNIRAQILIEEKRVRNAQMTYELNEIRYREGDLTGLQISQYQSQLSSARTSLVREQINYKNELLNLKILTLYDFENDKPILPVRKLNN